MIAVIMPVIAAVGCVAIIIVVILAINAKKRDQIKSIDKSQINQLAEQLIKDNSEIKRDISEMKEKIESMEKMMRDI